MLPRLDKRFWSTTRGRLILLLRPENRTVNELADALALTDNAVRAHLTALERDGLVLQSGSRPGTRKPYTTYSLAPEAEQLFPKLYGPILRLFLDEMRERVSQKKLIEIARAVGHRLAESYPRILPGKPWERIEQALALLRELGGFCVSDGGNGTVLLRCIDCPLAVAVEGHPEACELVETVLADVLGVTVHQRCQQEPSPKCFFEIETGAA